jgi:hypothetical protein
LVFTLATAVATPAFGQAVAPTVGSANGGSESAEVIPDFSGLWVHALPGFEPLPSGPTALVNRSRRPNGTDGTATKVGVFVQLSGGLAGPDGLALDDEEGLAIAHAGYGVVWICNRLGDPVIAIRSPEGIYTTNVAHGGTDRRDLYITESYSATILRARVDVPGRKMFSHL